MMRALTAEKLSWPDVHVFQTDERVVPPESPDRTLMRLREALLSRAPLPPAHVHAMPVEESDLAAAARRYGELLERYCGAPAVLDLIHLGLGADGHMASLVPGDPVLDVADADVALSGPYQGHRRMTLTYPLINRARAIVWLVTGEEKAIVLRRLCEEDPDIPAGRIRRDRAVIVADRAAAWLVSKDMYDDDSGSFQPPEPQDAQ
jgi:6-phosphogluconolactonase